LLSTTISTTRTPSAIHAQEIMPYKFICLTLFGLLATELSGSFSETLPTLGREISLDASLEIIPPRALETPLDTPLDTVEEADTFFGFFEEALLGALEDDEAFEEDGACEEEGVTLDTELVEEGGCEEVSEMSGMEEICWDPPCSEFPEPAEGETAAPSANTLREQVNSITVSMIKMDSAFLRLLIKSPPSALQLCSAF
jgi:hypothetical protein